MFVFVFLVEFWLNLRSSPQPSTYQQNEKEACEAAVYPVQSISLQLCMQH